MPFLEALFLFEILILPAERIIFFKRKTKTKTNEIKVARVLTYGGQIIVPTAHIFICHVMGYMTG